MVKSGMAATAAFSEIIILLDKFFDVCRELGLQAEAQGGRFGVYRSRLEQLSDQIARLRAGEEQMPIYRQLTADLPRNLVALTESQEIGSIMPFLQACPPQDLAPRVRAMLAGPELPSDEDGASNQARNIQFELRLAAILWAVGLDVELAEPDLRCKIGDATVFFACKRILSVRKLTKRINEATKQLRRALKVHPEAWGFIAISLSRVLANPSRSEVIANRSEGLAALASRIERIVTRARWHQTRAAQGVVFHLASMFSNSETDRIEAGSFLTLYGDSPICAALAAKLQTAADN